MQQADIDLLAEGCYFIVSLDYLVRSGFPSWPEDKPETTYRNDAIALLADLRTELIDAIESGRDPLPVFEKTEQVYWWTEGFTTAPDVGVSFEMTDSFVAAALARIAAKKDSV